MTSTNSLTFADKLNRAADEAWTSFDLPARVPGGWKNKVQDAIKTYRSALFSVCDEVRKDLKDDLQLGQLFHAVSDVVENLRRKADVVIVHSLMHALHEIVSWVVRLFVFDDALCASASVEADGFMEAAASIPAGAKSTGVLVF